VSSSLEKPLDFLSACSVNSVKKKNPIAQKNDKFDSFDIITIGKFIGKLGCLMKLRILGSLHFMKWCKKLVHFFSLALYIVNDCFKNVLFNLRNLN
jgi:hypothetical protein